MEEHTKHLLYELNLSNEVFYRVNPQEYAAKIRELSKDRNYWYQHITPREAADKLYEQTQGDYLKIWHEHCQSCFCDLDEHSAESFYRSDNGDWLCEKCFRKLQPYLREENKNI